MKETLYDRNETKLIERVCKMREQFPNIKVGEIDCFDGVYEVKVTL